MAYCQNIKNTLLISGKELKNRLVFGPHRTNFPSKHLPEARRIAYYAERAKGGVGMLIMEGSMVIKGDYPYDYSLNIHEEGALTAYSQVVNVLEKYNTVLVGQLNHFGIQGDSIISRKPLWGASPVPEVNSNEMPHVMGIKEIKELQAGFQKGAALLVKAGFDGVEINVGQNSLLRQFISPLTNQRIDEYGGDLANRVKLTIDVLQLVRKEVGDNILGLRLCGDEYAPWGGLDAEAWAEVAKYITDRVKIDYIAVETGSLYSGHLTMASIRQPEDYAVASAKTIAEAVSIPVIAGGALCTPALVDEVLGSNIALADITRALIADPEWPVKVCQGKPENIRPCIRCREGCNVTANTNPLIGCAVNPMVGLEHKQKQAKAFKAKNIAVAGGGPAGLTAALTLAERGHNVTLYEQRDYLGGNWAIAANFPGQESFGKIIEYLDTRAVARGVHIELNQALNAAVAMTYDAVVIATGSTPPAPLFNIGDGVNIAAVEEIVSGNIPEGKNALVWDELGEWRAVDAAKALVNKGYQVLLANQEAYLASLLVKKGEFSYWYQELSKLPITTKTQCNVEYAGKDEVRLANKFTGQKKVLPGVDLVVRVTINNPNQILYNELLGKKPVYLAGDAETPRGFMWAVASGYRVGQEI